MLFPIPDSMDYPPAAAFPIAYGTSHLALEHRAKLQPGETLLVLGASGGVGLTAVEIGRLMGATVIAAASSPEKLDVAKRAGADHLINYSDENLRDRVREITQGRGANVIYDPVGGDLFDQALRCIAWEGRLLVIGFASGRIPQLAVNSTLVKNYAVVGVYWGAYAANNPVVLVKSLRTLFGWYSEGKLRPHISQTFPLAQTADAFNLLIERRSTGKVVITL
jgi:NADPH2:quinone reductase